MGLTGTVYMISNLLCIPNLKQVKSNFYNIYLTCPLFICNKLGLNIRLINCKNNGSKAVFYCEHFEAKGFNTQHNSTVVFERCGSCSASR